MEYELYVNAGIDDDNTETRITTLQFILEDKPLELNAINDSLDLGFRNLFAVSNYVQLDAEGRPIIDDVDVRSYFCWIYGCAKKSIAPATYAVIGTGNRGGIRLQTYPNTGIVPYDYPSATKYRMKKKAIAFSIKFTCDYWTGINPHISALRFLIFEIRLTNFSSLLASS